MRRPFLLSIVFGLLLAFTSYAQTSGPAVGSGAISNTPVYAIHQDNADQVITTWLGIQSDFVGIRETRTNSSPEVDKFLAAVYLKPGYAWCSAFQVYTNLEACKANGVRSALPRRAAVRVLARDLVRIGTRLPNYMAGERGQLMCFGKPNTPYGHVAMVERPLGNGKLRTLEGNTGPDGGRDGDGVYRKTRPIAGYKSLRTTHFFKFTG